MDFYGIIGKASGQVVQDSDPQGDKPWRSAEEVEAYIDRLAAQFDGVRKVRDQYVVAHIGSVPSTLHVTTAPESYDGFGTYTVRILGRDPFGRQYRLVDVQVLHADWQCNRYWSGMHLGTTYQEFQADPLHEVTPEEVPS